MGYTEGEVIGKNWFENFLPKSSSDEFSAVFGETVLKDDHGFFQDTVLTKAGQERIIAWSNARMQDSAGEVIGVISIGADVTERERAFEEINRLKDRLQEENIYLQEEIVIDHNHRNIIGKSDALKYALTRVGQVGPTDTTVLIEGETGTGKELIARAVHQASPRKERPLVKVNCAVIPLNLMESELFGHEQGAFTGAHKMRKGRFELAHRGTLFLDEIGELPHELQAKLLQVLEDGEFERLGSNNTIKVDVRIIAATNRVLKDEVKANRFRGDLYYRLSAYPISIPPLRKRREDIAPLVQFFIETYNRRFGKHIETIPRECLDTLTDYDWPGNVRELCNVIERAVISSKGKKLLLPERLESPTTGEDDNGAPRLPLEEIEKQYIIEVLAETKGKISGENGAAKILGLHPNTLRFRMQKLGIKKSVVSQ